MIGIQKIRAVVLVKDPKLLPPIIETPVRMSGRGMDNEITSNRRQKAPSKMATITDIFAVTRGLFPVRLRDLVFVVPISAM